MSIGESLKILADPVRRDILLLLKKEKRTAGSIAVELDISPAALSYHLRLLKQGDFVLEYREKNFIWYEINATVFDELLLWIQQFRGDAHEKE
ncbi:MAG: winged helix-turn-helix transcriptional regulator [Oscillospiraceae bacterium]|nr:winged helix-turn-helix transcriptional regulator [Oscillospiraceae bacterium]